MNFEEARALILKSWDSPTVQAKVEEIGGETAAWFMEVDDSAEYSIDRECVGIRQDGTFVWAYASGCSCWDGDYEVENIADEPTLKVFSFKSDEMSKKWMSAFLAFAESLVPTTPDGLAGTALPEAKL